MAALLRLADIQRGSIMLGGQDIRTMPLRALRQRCGYVPQATFLFEVHPPGACAHAWLVSCRPLSHTSLGSIAYLRQAVCHR